VIPTVTKFAVDGVANGTVNGAVNGNDMTSSSGSADDIDVRTRLRDVSGVLGWDELARHFARGVVVKVDPRLDLIDVGATVVDNDTEGVQRWLDGGALARASDDDARDWVTRAPDFLVVVAAPWVLVQEQEQG